MVTFDGKQIWTVMMRLFYYWKVFINLFPLSIYVILIESFARDYAKSDYNVSAKSETKKYHNPEERRAAGLGTQITCSKPLIPPKRETGFHYSGMWRITQEQR